MDHGLPDYANLSPETLVAACRSAISAGDEAVAAIVAIPAAQRTYVNTLLALEAASQALTEAEEEWGFLSDVAPGDVLRERAREWQQRLRQRTIGLLFDEDLHRAVREFAETAQAATLTGEDARFLEHTLRDYRRNGCELPQDERRRLRTLFEELSRLATDFSRAVADWQDGIEVEIEDLDGLSASFIAGLDRVDGRYRVSLAYPEFKPFMAEARSAQRRRELLEKDLRKGGIDNVVRLERAIVLRTDIARTLGYDSWVDYVTETYTAKSSATVVAFLDQLRDRVAAGAAKDTELLAEANEVATGVREVRPWDLMFALNELKRTSYSVDDVEVAEYLPLDACLDGLFTTTSELFGVDCREVVDTPVWHPDVRVYDMTDAETGQPIARYYLDLFPRQNKYTHAAACSIRRGRRLPDGSYQAPVAMMMTNFPKPTAELPSLLRHADLVTLFHEFGHILHGTLATAEHGRFSGETELDFQEAPSQLMEGWCWDRDTLRRLARHHASGVQLPEDLLDRLVKAKNVGSSVLTMRQIFFASLDLAYHSPGFDGDSTATLEEVYRQHGTAYLDGTHFQSGFLHLFGGYAGGMYGYLWSRVLSEDMYTRFDEAGSAARETGDRYRRTVLAPGGSVDGIQLVRNFLGREPTSEAFLKGLGI